MSPPDLIKLASAGVIVSFAFGPSGSSRRICWTVQCMGPDGSEFDAPFAARDLEHAVEIAMLESRARGWLKENDS
jgi:hypothetical protein